MKIMNEGIFGILFIDFLRKLSTQSAKPLWKQTTRTWIFRKAYKLFETYVYGRQQFLELIGTRSYMRKSSLGYLKAHS